MALGEPLRLRADAYSISPSPAGLVVLQGEDVAKPWLHAEGLVWVGANDAATGDILTLSMRFREVSGRGEARVGRQVVQAGAVRPIHLDGVNALGRAPTGTTLELFSGIPVVPRFGSRATDWAVGGRVAQTLFRRATFGAAYVQQRERGEIANEEAGIDGTVVVGKAFDLAARAAYDLTSPGLSDALLSAAMRVDAHRIELFVTERSPSRMLPATSLFSVFGDTPSTRAGSTAKIRLAPRLDLLATAALQHSNDRLGHDLLARATLRTDDDGKGTLGLELRRQAVGDARWWGTRAFANLPIAGPLRASAELELVRLDGGRHDGDVRPWGLLAFAYRSENRWTFSAGAEAASTNTARAELNALLRLSYSLERP